MNNPQPQKGSTARVADPTVCAHDTRHLVLLWAKSLHVRCVNLTETHISQSPVQSYENYRTANYTVGPAYLHPGPLGLHQRQVGQHACLHLLVQTERQGKGQMQGREVKGKGQMQGGEVKGPLQAWEQGKCRHPPSPSSSPADITSQ